MPIIAVVGAIAVLGIIGMPLFNGFISKSIFHHSIVVAYQYGSPVYRFAEITFNVISVETAMVFLKMYTMIFLGKMHPRYEKLQFKYTSLHAAMIAVALMITLLGLFPRFIMNRFILPSASPLAFSSSFVESYGVLLRYFAWPELSLMAMILSAAVAFNHRYESAFTMTDALVYGTVLLGLMGWIVYNIL